MDVGSLDLSHKETIAMTSPLFTIVVPVYNRAHLIGRTLQSVLDQTCQDFEIVVVDDGSKDDIEAAISGIGDPRIRLIRQENGGGGAARNNGIEHAIGQYIAFLDSDDLFMPDKLERYAREFPLPDNAVLYSSMNVDRGVDKYWIRPDRPITDGEDVGEYLFCANQLIQTSTLVVPAPLAKRVKFDPGLRRGQDLDFCIRLQRAGAAFRMLNEPLTIWFDDTEAGRTSYVKGYETSLNWLTRAEPLLTRKAKIGYRATVLAYHMGPVKPFVAMRDLFNGWMYGGVSTRVTARQMLRAFLPRSFYRTVVNSFVAKFGR
jgi:glycosyltransferase involved in cell wall biosynthesis